MTDLFNRKVTYARISITDRCNLACKYCMPLNCENKTKKNEMSYDEIENVIDALVELGILKIRFTGGEPLIRKNVLDFFEKVCPKYNVKWAITTNATTLEKNAQRLLNAGIKNINISFDTFDRDDYKKITGFDIENAKKGLEKALCMGFEKVKINCVLIDKISQKQIKNLAQLTIDYNVDVRFIELMPIGQSANWAKKHLLCADKVLEILSDFSIKECEKEKQEKHSPALYYKLKDGKGRIGIIAPISCNFCADCNRIRITSDGKIKPCLHSDVEISFKDVLFDKQKLKHRIIEAINVKPQRHYLKEQKFISRNMSQIGG